MKKYTTPTLKISIFASDDNIIASKPSTDNGDTPEGAFPNDSATPLPDDPFTKK